MALSEGSMAERLSTHFRQRRDARLRRLISRIGAGRSAVTILDMGGSGDYWLRVGLDFLRSANCHVTIVNLVESELGDQRYPPDLFTLAVGDACRMPHYADRQFDLAHSNSVVEHLGTWPAMRHFAAETKRVARNYYVQTPNFWFPIDPHYFRFPLFHWLPRPVRAQLFRRFAVAQGGRARDWDTAYGLIDASRLLDRRQMATLFADAELVRERLAGLTKSLVAIRDTSGSDAAPRVVAEVPPVHACGVAVPGQVG
jgi:hypothetical protein